MRDLNPAEELKHLKVIFGENPPAAIYNYLISSFYTIQTRAQILLSLATICLTITGFSGPKIALSNELSRYSIAIGLLFVLISITYVLTGPLHIKWATQAYGENLDQTIEELIKRRNRKTIQYHKSMSCLAIGLSFYVLSVISFLIIDKS
jgi:hypothetical protein